MWNWSPWGGEAGLNKGRKATPLSFVGGPLSTSSLLLQPAVPLGLFRRELQGRHDGSFARSFPGCGRGPPLSRTYLLLCAHRLPSHSPISAPRSVAPRREWARLHRARWNCSAGLHVAPGPEDAAAAGGADGAADGGAARRGGVKPWTGFQMCVCARRFFALRCPARRAFAQFIMEIRSWDVPCPGMTDLPGCVGLLHHLTQTLCVGAGRRDVRFLSAEA